MENRSSQYREHNKKDQRAYDRIRTLILDAGNEGNRDGGHLTEAVKLLNEIALRKMDGHRHQMLVTYCQG